MALLIVPTSLCPPMNLHGEVPPCLHAGIVCLVFNVVQNPHPCTVVIVQGVIACIYSYAKWGMKEEKSRHDQSLLALWVSSINYNYTDRDNPWLTAAHILVLLYGRCLAIFWASYKLHVSVTYSLFRKYLYFTKKREREEGSIYTSLDITQCIWTVKLSHKEFLSYFSSYWTSYKFLSLILNKNKSKSHALQEQNVRTHIVQTHIVQYCQHLLP